jgi:hypothetical protein
MFRYNLSVPFSMVKKSKSSWISWPLKMAADRLCRNHYTLRNIPEQSRSQGHNRWIFLIKFLIDEDIMSKWTAPVAFGGSTAGVCQNRIQESDNFQHFHARDNPCVYILYFFFFNRHYNPSWVSACSTVFEHSQKEGFTECRCQRHVKPPT